jgi:DNA polymerase
MRTLAIDIETYSSIDLIKSGVYRYIEAPDFEVLMIAYAYDDGPVELLDTMNVTVTDQDTDYWSAFWGLLDDLKDPQVIKTAYNANFERTCLARLYTTPMPPEEWRCTAVHAATLGLPRSLADVGRAIGLPEDKQKLKTGKALIDYFCKPCKPTKANGMRTRNLPKHSPERWAEFKAYCIQDVEVERTIRRKLEAFPVPTSEQNIWTLDQYINDRGVLIDRPLVLNAIKADGVKKAEIIEEITQLTGLNNPNSIAQLKGWLEDTEDIEIESLNKATVPELLKGTDSAVVRRVLNLRKELGKTSVSKYKALERAANNDDRIRGTMLFYGARTGRWAGRIFQPQNLPHNKLADLEFARLLLYSYNIDAIEAIYGDVPDTLSQLIRTALVPKPGHKFIVSDFSAIEARVIAWLSGEKWRMEVFKTHGKIYEASAAQMFKVPIETIAKGEANYGLRQKGKIAELALGYGGAAGALDAMGALKMGLTMDELPGIVSAWRNANPALTGLWWAVGDAALEAIEEGFADTHGLAFTHERGYLFIRLPSGRRLAYPNARIEENKFGRPGMVFDGIDGTRKTWGKIDTYGPKLVENIVQAISRDILAESMLRLDREGYKIVMHVHDEVIIEAPITAKVEDVENIMGQVPEWALGLPMRADGYECAFYKKD